MAECVKCSEHEHVRKMSDEIPSIIRSLAQIKGGIVTVSSLLVLVGGVMAYAYNKDIEHQKELNTRMWRQIEKNSVSYQDLFEFKLSMKKELTKHIKEEKTVHGNYVITTKQKPLILL